MENLLVAILVLQIALPYGIRNNPLETRWATSVESPYKHLRPRYETKKNRS